MKPTFRAFIQSSTIGLLLAARGAAADEPLAPWGANRHPSDVARRHVEEISSKRQQYAVFQGGTMDGENTRSPQGVWQPFEQTWESNRSVRIQNVGTTDVVNPWLASGRGTLRSLDEIVAAAAGKDMSDKDRARALWWQQIQHRFHQPGDNNELMDPVKVLNVYGHNTCGNDSIALAGLWKKAGFKVAPARLVGHCVTQVYYDDAWHLMDGDMHSIYLLRDNETVAGEQDLVRDHDLIRRTHTQGILQTDRRASDEWESSIYVHEGTVNGDRNSPENTTMNMMLRPGEALTWRWGRLTPVKRHGTTDKQHPDRVCNGLWEFRPDFTTDAWRKGTQAAEGVIETKDGLAAQEGKSGQIMWAMRSPYVFVGGRLEAAASGATFSLSFDGKSWEDIGDHLDKYFPPTGPARYSYYLRCQLSGEARLTRLAITNDLQMAPLSLPAMTVGHNSLVYTDQSPGERKLVITHEWVERSASKPPLAPPTAVFPTDGGQSSGTDVVFQWTPPSDPDGHKIADYHFELSNRADMRWPLSMSFAKLISRTADAGRARYTLPGPGLLNPGQTYFWRVRAKDELGVWGPWSKTFQFTPRGPAHPLNVSLEYENGVGTLRWTPNPKGRKPVEYRVYASDEQGFSVSDEPYAVTVGISKELSERFPANFVVQTKDTQLAAVGPGVELTGGNKAFYRVVAVDEAGQRSGPSEYAASPRPVVTRVPQATAKVGVAYTSEIAVVRSLGDLRMRLVNGKETMNFWDIERPKFTLQKGPAWLKLDESTGVLSGTPDAAGPAEVEIVVTLERELRKLDEALLKWGQERVVSSGTQKVGSATHRFTMVVER